MKQVQDKTQEIPKQVRNDTEIIMISIISAMDSKRGIGKNNSIPWHIPEDFKRFKALTMGHPIIMGRRTFESLGRVLPGRTHIVITRDLENKTEVDNVFWVDSLEKAIDKAKQLDMESEFSFAKASEDKKIFIIGGGQIFQEALEKGIVDKLYLTIVEGDFKADTFFPEYPNFKKVSEEKHDNGKNKFKFVNLTEE